MRVGAHGHPCHVDVAVGDRLQGQVLLGRLLAGGGELRDGRQRRGLRRLATGVGVHLGVEHQHVHVAAARQHVVETTGADVVGPAVAADQPDAAPQQVVGDAAQVVDLRPGQPLEAPGQLRHPLALGLQLRLADLRRRQDRLGEVRADGVAQLVEPAAGEAGVQVGGQPQAEPELGVVLEERVGPGRPAPAGVRRPGGRRQVAAVDRRAARRVRDRGTVAEQLGQQLEVGRLPAPRARPRELEERLEELRSAHRAEVDPAAVVHGQGLEERDVLAFGLEHRLERAEVDRLR